MEAQGGKEEQGIEYKDALAIQELPLSVTKTNEKENETKSNQSQTQNTKNEENQLVSVTGESKHNTDGLVEIVEIDAFVEAADEDSNTEQEVEHRVVDDKVEELELNEVGESNTVAVLGVDIIPSEDTVEEELEEEESEDLGDYQTDILTPALSLLIFNIIMPCVDFYFDAVLIRILFSNNWGCLFILVCALATNFLFTSFAWWRIEPKRQKAWTWIFLILQIWPQLKAVQVQLVVFVSTQPTYLRPSGWC